MLIVEDELPMLQLLDEHLKNSGFDTTIAHDGEEGLTQALAQHPDIILLDILMPKMDGLTVLKHLREDVWGKHVPVIIFTNVGVEDSVISQLVQYDPAYYFMKSDMKLDDLVTKIGETLQSPSNNA